MHKITRKIYFIILCLTTFTLYARGIYYNDRLMIYIDNKVTDFSIEKDQLTTSISEINNILKDQGVNSIAQWLPNARPSDRNGNIFLNRYYVVEFESVKNDMDEIINDLMVLDVIMVSERIPIVEPAYVPNDSLWDELYGLSQIKAHLAFDLWDIDGGEIPGQMENGERVVAIPDIGL